jgi:hypothetical protein
MLAEEWIRAAAPSLDEARIEFTGPRFQGLSDDDRVELLDTVAELERDRPPDDTGATPAAGWVRVDLTDDDLAKPSDPPAIADLVYLGLRHHLSGVPEAMKTLVALILGLELIRAGHGTFALVDFEQNASTVRRILDDLGATREELERIQYIAAPGPPTDDDIDQLIAGGVALVIIDAAAGMFDASGLDDHKSADVEKAARQWITPFHRRGTATLLIDHVVKNAEQRGRFAVGSQRKAGATDVHLGLEIKKQLSRGTDGLIVVHTHKDRPGWLRRPRAAEIEIHSHETTHALTWTIRPATTAGSTDDDWRPTHLMAKVSTWVATQPAPVSKNQIEKAGLGKAQYVRQAVDALHADGYFTAADGPRNSTLYTSVKPYLVPVPTSSQPVPDDVTTTSSHLVPPLQRGRDEVDEVDEVARLEALGDELGLTSPPAHDDEIPF